MTTTHTNRLIHASSPYLLQHAYNPVDWHEWGEEALHKARTENKLILVSIGYSACHWCHVMEKECFEDEEVAALMNTHFICIKVDREERPDIDQLYMDAVQLLTGRGGWPLNCFALPDGRPLHGGTYFPKAEWKRVLQSVASFYENKREEALQHATDLTQGIKKLDVFPQPDAPLISIETLEAIITKWSSNFDTHYGGYTWAPKFPMPTNWMLFLQMHQYKPLPALLEGVHTTLIRMAEGGLYDQIGGGFTRYSTDTYWKVPHFEKMLYDNGQLLSLYSRAWLQSRNPLYERVVMQTIAFVNRELTSPEGLFYSALDADSEGVEGKFYVWSQDELKQVLGVDEPLFSLYYSVDAYGNWEHNNILYKTRSDIELQQLTGMPMEHIESTIQRCIQKLLKHRQNRVRPGLDDKIITSWNALMIQGLSDAYMAFRKPDILETGCRAADALWQSMWQNNRLYRIAKDGKISIHGFAEDYALLSQAFISLAQCTSDETYLHQAHQLMQKALSDFYDEEKQLFYFTSIHDEALATRKLDVNDDVIPSANSTFALNLYSLSYLFDKPEYIRIADQMLHRVQSKFEKFPSGFTQWMQLILLKTYGFRQVIITGSEAQLPLYTNYHPHTCYFVCRTPSDIPLFKEKPVTDTTTYHVCTDNTCGLPQTEWKHAEAGLLFNVQ